ncbi:MAG: hypothetical protein EZS28_025567, partial [Streblomastix strix]
KEETVSKTIMARVKNAMINTVNYTKIGQKEGEKKQLTGKLIDLTLVEDGDLCVIDFDINKKLSFEETDKIRQNIIDNMLPANVGLVKTAHGGLHAYYNRDGNTLLSNRYVQVQGTQKNGTKGTCIKSSASLREILDSWNVDIERPLKEYVDKVNMREFGWQITEEGTIDKMNDEIAQACVNELKNLEIHNYPQPINMEVSLLSVFAGIYGITNEQIRAEGLGNIRKFNKLTANAEKNYGQAAFNGERYSSKNITDIDDFVGKFNTAIENKMLAIANETKNFGESRMSNMDALKSINTESSFVINEKYVSKHEVENVMNIIIVTNNIFPLKIENIDRRYVVCMCNSVHRGDLAYFTNLCNSFDEDFYSNLFTFFMTRDISQFNPRNIPMTQAKKDIIKASISQVDDVIISHFKSFRDGVTCNIVEGWKPQEMKLKNYQLAIKNICVRTQKQTDGVCKFIYKLKEEMISIYENMLDEDADEIDSVLMQQEKQQEIQNDDQSIIDSMHSMHSMHYKSCTLVMIVFQRRRIKKGVTNRQQMLGIPIAEFQTFIRHGIVTLRQCVRLRMLTNKSLCLQKPTMLTPQLHSELDQIKSFIINKYIRIPTHRIVRRHDRFNIVANRSNKSISKSISTKIDLSDISYC